MSPRFVDRLQTSSRALGNSINVNRVHITIEIYTSSLRSFISHYKATLFGRVHVLIPQNKTSLLHFCTHTVILKLEHCTKSQWRYSGDELVGKESALDASPLWLPVSWQTSNAPSSRSSSRELTRRWQRGWSTPSRSWRRDGDAEPWLRNLNYGGFNEETQVLGNVFVESYF